MKRLCFLFVVFAVAATVHAQSASNEPLFILFPANSADLRDVEAEQAIRNSEVFARVARLLADNSQYRILIDGHANPVLGTAREENEVLRPLSEQRAEAAADFLVNYFNVDRRRLITSGGGGSYTVETSNLANNRRVNFVVVSPR
jgi:outer membrane protein OmpA-like peptidoglycan-associated protein